MTHSTSEARAIMRCILARFLRIGIIIPRPKPRSSANDRPAFSTRHTPVGAASSAGVGRHNHVNWRPGGLRGIDRRRTRPPAPPPAGAQGGAAGSGHTPAADFLSDDRAGH